MSRTILVERALILAGICLLSGACGEQRDGEPPAARPEYEPAASPEACLRNTRLAAEAKDFEGLKACFPREARDLIKLARPKVEEVAESIDLVLRALEQKELMGAYRCVADHDGLKSFSVFDEQLFEQFSEDEGATWSIESQGDSEAVAHRGAHQYSLVFEQGEWRVNPYLPGCLNFFAKRWGTSIRGRLCVDYQETPYSEVKASLGTLDRGKEVLEQLGQEVLAGKYESDSAFLNAYNDSIQDIK